MAPMPLAYALTNAPIPMSRYTPAAMTFIISLEYDNNVITLLIYDTIIYLAYFNASHIHKRNVQLLYHGCGSQYRNSARGTGVAAGLTMLILFRYQGMLVELGRNSTSVPAPVKRAGSSQVSIQLG